MSAGAGTNSTVKTPEEMVRQIVSLTSRVNNLFLGSLPPAMRLRRVNEVLALAGEVLLTEGNYPGMENLYDELKVACGNAEEKRGRLLSFGQ